MFSKIQVHVGLVVFLILALFVETGLAGSEKKIYIVTDLEGISGVFKFSQTRETDTPLAREAREYFMGDVAAVARGLRDGGATEVVVLDGHGNQAVIPHLMEPGAKYITGTPRPGVFCGLDNTFAGVVLLGFHAMMGTPDGVLNHTQSSKSENRYWYNDVESGELVQSAVAAGSYGIPPILVTGDEATCREAEKFFGKTCVTVAVKKGVARESAMLYPFEETRQKLYKGAKQAMKIIPECKPYKLDMPVKAKMQHLVFEGTEKKPKLVTKEGTVTNALQMTRF
ncbi:MAG: M55 family metallopeptidase [Kiritimatiellae bacterium]|nr:M55 family metallopeptidase [Kiritimatiellia bacterium]MDD5520247.1 M55 family metallopeptidase [Kiritimatiellia bacterium]